MVSRLILCSWTSHSLVSFRGLGQVIWVKEAPRSFYVITILTPPFPISAPSRDSVHRQGRDRGKRKEEKGRAIGREARAQELTSKAVLVLGTSAPLLLPAHIPQPVSGVSWHSWASTLAGLGSKLPLLCQGIIIPILQPSSPGGSFFFFGPHIKPAHRCLCVCLLPGFSELPLQSPLHCCMVSAFAPMGAIPAPSPFSLLLSLSALLLFDLRSPLQGASLSSLGERWWRNQRPEEAKPGFWTHPVNWSPSKK